MKRERRDPFLEKRLKRYDQWLGAGQIPYASRVVPVRESFETKQWVMPGEQAMEILRAADVIALNNCECRVHYKRCDNPLEVCFLMGDFAVKSVEKGRARRVSLEEAEAVLRHADAKGLVHLSFHMPGNKVYAFCSCCRCCCHDLQLLRLYNRTDLVARSEYTAVIDRDACTDCGACVARCPFAARTMENARMRYCPDACYGCGLCVTACPEKVTALKRKVA